MDYKSELRLVEQPKIYQKGATDIEIAFFYFQHIENPCVEPTTGQNIREFYLKLAQKELPRLQNPHAKTLLEDTIAKYSPK